MMPTATRLSSLVLLSLLSLPAMADTVMNQYQPISPELQLQLQHEMRSAARSPLLSANTRALRDAWAKGLHAPEACEADFADSALHMAEDISGLTIVHRDKSHLVMEFQCGLGAYQGSYQYTVLDLTTFQVKWLNVPQYTFEDKAAQGQVVQEPTITGLPTWDPKRPNHLSMFSKARGIGDCGMLSDYQLTKDYTLALTQVKARDCDDEHMPTTEAEIDPVHWPVVYPKK